MGEPSTTLQPGKYIVRPFGAGWRIVTDAGQSETYAHAEAAVRDACRAARETALEGQVCLVVTETIPRELHCYMPATGAGATPVAALPDYLRLVVPDA